MYMHAASYQRAMKLDRTELERALKPGGIGYRFVFASADWESKRRTGETLTLRQQWVNRNASWCVQPYRLKLFLQTPAGRTAWSGVDKTFDPRSWLSGTNYTAASSFRLPTNLKPGSYELRIALVDESETPSVRLGIGGADEHKRYKLGAVTISGARK